MLHYAKYEPTLDDPLILMVPLASEKLCDKSMSSLHVQWAIIPSSFKATPTTGSKVQSDLFFWWLD